MFPKRLHWPDPDSSRGRELAPLSTRYGNPKRCWETLPDGLAFQKYLEIKPDLLGYFEHHPKLMRGPDVGLSCCMVGRDKDFVRPAIIIHCEVGRYRETAATIIKAGDEWKRFKKDNPLFLLLRGPRAPSLLALRRADGDSLALYSEQIPFRFCGLSIISFPDREASSPSVATLGGIVLVDGRPYGLTVAHAVQSAASHEESTVIPEANSAGVESDYFYDSDDPDDEFYVSTIEDDQLQNVNDTRNGYPTRKANSFSMFDLAPAGDAAVPELEGNRDSLSTSSMTHAQPSLIPFRTTEKNGLQMIGRVVEMSTDYEDNEYDWALCELKEQYHQSPVYQLAVNKIVLGNGSEQRTHAITRLAGRSWDAQEVFVVTASKGLVRGDLGATPYMYRVRGHPKFIETFRIHLDQALSVGDCGSWVVSSENRIWFGHVIAGQALDTTAYLIPASALQKNVEQQLAVRFDLPTNFWRSPQMQSQSIEIPPQNFVPLERPVEQDNVATSAITNPGNALGSKPSLQADRDVELPADTSPRYAQITPPHIREKLIEAAAGRLDRDLDFFSSLLQKRRNSYVPERVAEIAARNIWNGEKMIRLLLAREENFTAIEAIMVAAASNERDGERVTGLLLSHSIDAVINEAVMTAAASNRGRGIQVFQLLLGYTTGFLISEPIFRAAASNSRFGGNLMISLAIENGAKFTRQLFPIIAKRGRRIAETVKLLLNQHGQEIQITERILQKAAESTTHGTEIIRVLLDLHGAENQITEPSWRAKAKNSEDGAEIMRLLLNHGGPKLQISEPVLQTAAENSEDGTEIVRLLLSHDGRKLQITEAVLQAAAKNRGKGLEIMSFLLNDNGLELQITEAVLQAAAENNEDGAEIMRLLLSHDGRKLQITEAVLQAAAKNQRKGLEIMSFLLNDNGLEFQITEAVLQAAAESKNGAEIMSFLLNDNGLKLQITEAILQAAAQNKDGAEIMRLLLNHGGLEVQITEGILRKAANNENMIEIAKLLLNRDETGTNMIRLVQHALALNALGKDYGTALQTAAAADHQIVMQLLIDAGADVNAPRKRYGTALQAAAVKGHETMVELLLGAGADVNALGEESGTALQAAAAGGHQRVVQQLLDAGADINASGEESGTALQAAAAGGYQIVVQQLLKAGADVNAPGGVYGTALLAAAAGGHKIVVQQLLKAGADVTAPAEVYGRDRRRWWEINSD